MTPTPPLFTDPSLPPYDSPGLISPFPVVDTVLDGAPAPSAAPLDVEAARSGGPLKVVFIASEGVPYVKTGGLADVIGALPKALARLGHDVRVILPQYPVIEPDRWQLSTAMSQLTVPLDQAETTVDILEAPSHDGVRVYFVHAPHYFQREKLYGYPDDGERFILFCRAALEFLRASSWAPDIIHLHDWHTGIVPNWMKTLYKHDPLFARTASVFTIHNLAFQGIFGYRILEVAGVAAEGYFHAEIPELANVVDLMARGIAFADVVSTVSPRYAREILTPDFGERLDPLLRERKERLYGILNGIDTREYDPANDEALPSAFDAFSLERRPLNKQDLQSRMGLPQEPHTPLVGIISRLTDQKGFDLLEQIAVPLVEQGIQLVVAGTGDQHYHSMFQRLAARYPKQVSVNLTFGAEVSRHIFAGSDLLLMPSRFEPCGLTQMLAMRYGSIPVVHRTGGLADTVREFDPAAQRASDLTEDDAADHHGGNGFSFSRYDPFQLFAAVIRALEVYRFPDVWQSLMQRAMLADYSWDASAEQYVALYRRAQELQRLGQPSQSNVFATPQP